MFYMNNTGRFCTVFQLVRICRFFYTVAIRKQNTGKFFFCVFSRLNKALNIRFFGYFVTCAYTHRNSCFYVLLPVSIQPESPDRLTADEAVFLFVTAMNRDLTNGPGPMGEPGVYRDACSPEKRRI